MIAKLSRRVGAVVAGALLAVLLATTSGAVRAQTGTTVDYTFGKQVSFARSLTTATPVRAAELVIRALPNGPSVVLPAAVTTSAGSGQELRATHDLTAQPLPPFAEIEFYWVLTPETGSAVELGPETFVYDDNRFTWRTAARGAARVHWYAGDLEFGQAAADVAVAALQSIAQQLQADTPARLEVYVYASASDLQLGLQLGGRDWVAGHADPELGVVLATISPGAEQLLTMRRVIPHEIAHILIYRITGSGYTNVPGWLNEGIAVASENDRNPVYLQVLTAAAESDAILPFQQLCGSFPVSGDDAVLAYAQSGSLVDFISSQYGTAAIQTLLAAYADGATCKSGVQRALPTDLPGLQAAWERTQLNRSALASILRFALPAALIFLLPALSLAVLSLPLRSRASD